MSQKKVLKESGVSLVVRRVGLKKEKKNSWDSDKENISVQKLKDEIKYILDKYAFQDHVYQELACMCMYHARGV